MKKDMDYEDRFDERQKISKGKACVYGYAYLAILSMWFLIIRDVLDIEIFSNTMQISILLLPSFTIIVINMIINDAYDALADNLAKIVITVFGAVGFIMTVFGLVLMIKNSNPLFSNGLFNDDIGGVADGICFLTMCIIYWVHRIRAKKKITNEE